MKKYVFMILALLFTMPMAYSLESHTIKSAMGKIKDEFTSPDKLLFVYNDADEGAFIAVSFIFKVSQIGNLQTIKSDSELISDSELRSRNVVIFGGPCANKYWNKFSDETCENWPYKPGQSLAKVVDNNGHVAVLIAGTDKKDTWEIARLILQYNTNENLNKNSYLYHSQSKRLPDKTKCETDGRNYVCFLFPLNAQFTYSHSNKDYSILVKEIDTANNLVTFYLNNNPYSLELGQSIADNGIEITPDKIINNAVTAEPTNVEMHFSEPMDGFVPFGQIYPPHNCIAEGGIQTNIRTLIYLPNSKTPFDVTLYNVENGRADIEINGKKYYSISENTLIDNIQDYPVTLSKIQRSEPFKGSYIDSIRLCFE